MLVFGCGGQNGNGNNLQVSVVAGSYHGPFTTAAGGSGTFTITIGPTGAVFADLTNTSGSVTGTIAGTLSNGGGFAGNSTLSIITGSGNRTDNYTDVGTFVLETGGGMTATITSTLVTGTDAGTTTYMTLSYG
jgi:hypothetical protein